MLWTLQRVFLGTLPEKWKDLTDMDGREMVMLAPLAAIVIFLGIYPSPILDLLNASLNNLAGILHAAQTSGMMGVR
jgi:NADH-quinone oxidoreductase subunit M